MYGGAVWDGSIWKEKGCVEEISSWDADEKFADGKRRGSCVRKT